MFMTIFDLSLKSAVPERSFNEKLFPFEDTAFPSRGFDLRRGLRFPLEQGSSLVFQNDGKIMDLHGSLRISFSLNANDSGGQILESWGGYLRIFVEAAGECLEARVSAYGQQLRLLCPCLWERMLVLSFDWDNRTGLALSISEGKDVLKQTACNIKWHAYSQNCVPVSIGGRLESTRPGSRNWQNLFTGFISNVSAGNEAILPPGTPRIEACLSEPSILMNLPASCTVLELHAPPVKESQFRFDSIPDREENLLNCQKLHPELSELYHGAENAFEGLRRVGLFVANLWPHTEYWPWPREIFEERGDRLLADIKAGRTAGMCGGYAHTMEEALWALGIPARRVQVMNHSSLEAYDHQHGKWICLETDPLLGFAGTWSDPEGNPYCIGELVELIDTERREPGILSRRLKHLPLGASVPGGIENARQPVATAREYYLRMGFARRKDYRDPAPPLWFHYAPPAMRVEIPGSRDTAQTHTTVDDWRELYWSCDQLSVDIKWHKDGSGLNLIIKPFQSQFSTGCELIVDDSAPVRAGTGYDWKLHAGINRISLSATNRLGAKGHAWRMTVFKAQSTAKP